MSTDDNIITPEARLPFEFTEDGSILLVELNSDAEIQQAVFAVLAYEPGQLVVDPDFGTPSQAFNKLGVNVSQLEGIIQNYEPRADEVIERDPLWWESLVDTVLFRRDTSDGG